MNNRIGTIMKAKEFSSKKGDIIKGLELYHRLVKYGVYNTKDKKGGDKK